MILAQRNLTDRIVSAGEMVPQPHFMLAKQEYGPITADVYSTELQIRIPEEIVEGEPRYVVHLQDFKTETDPMATSLLKGKNIGSQVNLL